MVEPASMRAGRWRVFAEGECPIGLRESQAFAEGLFDSQLPSAYFAPNAATMS